MLITAVWAVAFLNINTAYVQRPAFRNTLAEKHVTKILKCFTISAALCTFPIGRLFWVFNHFLVLGKYFFYFFRNLCKFPAKEMKMLKVINGFRLPPRNT